MAQLSNLQQQRLMVEQLRREASIKRLPVSEVVEEIKQFINAHEQEDYLLIGFSSQKANPFREKSSCEIIQKGGCVFGEVTCVLREMHMFLHNVACVFTRAHILQELVLLLFVKQTYVFDQKSISCKSYQEYIFSRLIFLYFSHFLGIENQ